jgi:hypothetical protein
MSEIVWLFRGQFSSDLPVIFKEVSPSFPSGQNVVPHPDLENRNIRSPVHVNRKKNVRSFPAEKALTLIAGTALNG